ncbi:MAG: RND family transporter, partial [Synergistales bacterium]|nr:RND family transporter [Synergistales bacterium]
DGFVQSGSGLLKLRIPALLLVVVLVVPCFLAQSRTSFLYGGSSTDPSTRYSRDTTTIDEIFGKETAAVLLIPRGDPGRETALCKSLGDITHVTGVFSYVTSIGSSIPDGFLDETIVANFYSENYARIVIYTDNPEEGTEAFSTVSAIRSAAAEYYPESFLTGQSASLYDIKDVVTGDSMKVNLIAIAFILITLLVTFKSLTLPLILLFTIESAIWINLSIPYFYGTTLIYIGYLVVNTVQLGATIDYAILMTEGYYSNRAEMGARAAVEKTLGENFISVLTSALILSSAGFCLNFVSTAIIVSELGLLLARGTLISLALVLLVLPGLLLIFDRATTKLTLRSNFLKEEKKS